MKNYLGLKAYRPSVLNELSDADMQKKKKKDDTSEQLLCVF
jgi:hypothetical protein